MNKAQVQTATNATVELLPLGTELRHYRLIDVVGRGGFGVVYRAEDRRSGRVVAIKEFLPAAIAGRVKGTRIAPRKAEFAPILKKGIEGFMREAALLAELSHPALVSVIESWLENDTAYLAMEYYEGQTLRAVRETSAQPPTEAQLKAWIEPVMGAILELHARRIIHRDVSPDNILICRDGRSVLLDLGSARQIVGGMTQALTMVLKPGFAPIEQYVDDGSMSQGRWTDVYGLAGTLYFAVTGTAPLPATARLVKDSQPMLASFPQAKAFSAAFSEAVMRGLAMRAIERPKSIQEFRQLLGWEAGGKLVGATPSPERGSRDEKSSRSAHVAARPESQPQSSSGSYGIAALVGVGLLLVFLLLAWWFIT